jgi:hypothetical protein
MTSTNDDENCPVCFETYGLQEDGSFLYKDGVSNSYLKGHNCKHYLCINCWDIMYEKEIYNCPLCRENLKFWIINYDSWEDETEDEYDDDDYDETEDDNHEYDEERDQAEQEREEDEEQEREEAIERFQLH